MSGAASVDVRSHAAVAAFQSIFPGVAVERARELLVACTGKVDQAVELYLAHQGDADSRPAGTTAAASSVASKPSLARPPSRATARSRRTAAAAAAAAASTERVIEMIDDDDEKEPPVPMMDTSDRSYPTIEEMRKRKAPPAASPSRASHSGATPSPAKRTKKKSASDLGKDVTGQHSLASFFQRSPAAGVASPTMAPTAADARPKAPPAAAAASIASKLNDSTRSTAAAAAPFSAGLAAASSSSSSSSSSAAPSVAASSSPQMLSTLSVAGSSSTDPLQPCFSPGQAVPFLFVSRIYRLIEEETGRLRIINHLTYLLWQVLAYTPGDLAAALFLSSDQLAPSYENHQLGVGGRMLTGLVSEMTGVQRAQLHADHARLGDLGLIAAQYRHTQPLLFRPAPLLVGGVFRTFHSFSAMSKRDQKELALKKMFAAAREDELCYLIRIAEGGLRIGSVVTTVLSALAKAFVLHHLYTETTPDERKHEVCTFERVAKATDVVRGVKLTLQNPFLLDPIAPSAASTPAALTAAVAKRLPAYLAQATARIRRAYAELPSFHAILPVLLRSPTAIYELDQHIRLTAGIPIKPQLGRPMTSILSVLKLFKGAPFTVEVKYDGLRAQIHRLASMGAYRIFSRHLMDQGDRWSDLAPAIESAIKEPEAVQTFILDAEIVAVEHLTPEEQQAARRATIAANAADPSIPIPADNPTYRILPFQQLSTRKRGPQNGAGTGTAANGHAFGPSKRSAAAAASSKKAAASAASSSSSSARVEVSCMVYVFDFLSLNGRSLLLESLPQRRRRMAEVFREIDGQFQFVEHVDIAAEATKELAMEVEEEEAEEEEGTGTGGADGKGKKKAAVSEIEEIASSDEDEGGDDDGEDEDAPARSKKPSKTIVDEPDETAESHAPAAGAAAAAGAEPMEEEKKEASSDVEMSDVPPVGASASPSVASGPVSPPSAADQISSFLRSTAIIRGEGIMAKSLSSRSTYEPDVRTDQWCKLKKDYIAGFGIADSIDVCIIGAWWGNGRKAGWLSPFLAAVYNPETEELESFAKVMSGFTDEVYRQLTAECTKLIIPGPKKYYRVTEGLRPTMWFEPVRVWEIRGADLTISPAHSAGIGLVHESKGISLRFPRFIRTRDDKTIEQCTTSEQIAALYRGQQGVGTTKRRFAH